MPRIPGASFAIFVPLTATVSDYRLGRVDYFLPVATATSPQSHRTGIIAMTSCKSEMGLGPALATIIGRFV